MKISSTTLVFISTLMITIALPVNSEPSCHDFLKAGNATQAIAAAEAAIKQKRDQHDVWQCKGRALGATGQYQAGLNALEQAKSLAKARYDQMITHIFMGNLHQSNQAYADALTHYQTGLTMAQAEKNRQFTRILHHLIGDTHAAQHDYVLAMQSHEAGSQLALNDNERAESYANIAWTHQQLNQLNQAIEFQLKSVVMQQKAGTLDAYAEASLLLGQYFSQNKEYANAEKTYQKLLQFSKDNGGEYYEAKTNIYLAQTQLAQLNKAAASATLQAAKAVADKLNAVDLKALISDTEKAL